jgi:hypothetical protein
MKNTNILLISYLFIHTLVFAQPSWEFIEEIPSLDPSKFVELDEDKGKVDPGSFSQYLTDHCQYLNLSLGSESDAAERGLRRCKDGTVSFVQPPSEGWFKQEGKCGQTAASNLMYMHCRLIGSPSGYMEQFLTDVTPGVHPRTLSNGLNTIFKREAGKCADQYKWESVRANNEKAYFQNIERSLYAYPHHPRLITRTRADGSKVLRSPLALLLRVPNTKVLHWVTVVDLIQSDKSCEMFLNHWDNQYTVPCTEVAKWSRGVRNSYGLVLKEYSLVRLKY